MARKRRAKKSGGAKRRICWNEHRRPCTPAPSNPPVEHVSPERVYAPVPYVWDVPRLEPARAVLPVSNPVPNNRNSVCLSGAKPFVK